MSSKECVRMWVQVGHSFDVSPPGPGPAIPPSWRLWVRGVNDNDPSCYIHKVVFYLRPASQFALPKRVCQEPPYEIQDSSSSSIDVPIHIYLKFDKTKKICLKYNLVIDGNTKTNSDSGCLHYDFEDPPEQLRTALIKGGGEVIERVGNLPRNNAFMLLCDTGKHKSRKVTKSGKHKRIETTQLRCKHRLVGKSKAYLLKQLQADSMADDETTLVSHLYNSYNEYEHSEKALSLPPLSDPIYQLPELPPSLQEAHKGISFDGAWL